MKKFFLGMTAFVLSGTSAVALSNNELSLDPQVQTLQIIELAVEDIFADFSRDDQLTILNILSCESGGRNKQNGPIGTIKHLDETGALTINVNKDGTIDFGAGQINPQQHWSGFWARKQLDPTQIRENLLYMRALIEDKIDRGKSKFVDWKASRSCWKQPVPQIYLVHLSQLETSDETATLVPYTGDWLLYRAALTYKN
jgi:hypothetical protein